MDSSKHQRGKHGSRELPVAEFMGGAVGMLKESGHWHPCLPSLSVPKNLPQGLAHQKAYNENFKQN